MFDVPERIHKKDPNYVYRFCNTDERAMIRHQANGYEPVLVERTEMQALDPNSPTGSVTLRRGPDLVLCRIPRAHFEETINARRKSLREQHEGYVDNVVDQVNDKAMSSLPRSMRPPQGLVFKSSSGPEFAGATRPNKE